MVCPKCGAAAELGSRFCEACGASLAASAGGNGGPASAAAERCEIDLAHDLAAVADRGLIHPRNEDAAALLRSTTVGGIQVSILVVCDGVSTSHDPALGAKTAAAAAADSLSAHLATSGDAERAMRTAILEAHDAVCRLVPAGTDVVDRPLTTIVTALARAGSVTIGWAGDSRAYFLARGGRQLTRDDSWVNWVVERGEMDEVEAMRSANGPCHHPVSRRSGRHPGASHCDGGSDARREAPALHRRSLELRAGTRRPGSRIVRVLGGNASDRALPRIGRVREQLRRTRQRHCGHLRPSIARAFE